MYNCLPWRINTQKHVCIVAMEEIQTSSMSSVLYSKKKLELSFLISSSNFHFSASFDFILPRDLHAFRGIFRGIPYRSIQITNIHTYNLLLGLTFSINSPDEFTIFRVHKSINLANTIRFPEY